MSHEHRALQTLEAIIERNRQQNFVGIDRSPTAVQQRQNSLHMIPGKRERLSPFGAKLEHHVIQGDLSSEQASTVLLILYGLA